jgi:hypothetical protein
MSIFDATAYVIGEAAAHIVGRIIGHSFHIKPDRAKRIGENIVISLIIGSGIVVTFIYS